MTDEKKVKKKKKVKEEEPAPAPEPEPEPPAPAPTPTVTPASSKPSSRKTSSRKAKKTGSNVFDMFTQRQVAEFKEGFQMMDKDKDGIIGKSDLRQVFDEVGRIATDKELDDMLAETPNPINFTMLLQMFAERNTGESDDDDVVAAAFNAFSKDGWIDGDMFRHALMTWGDKYSVQEVDDAFDQFEMDDQGFIDTAAIIQLLTGAKSDMDNEAEAV
ncbi:myosin regulatory light chain 2-like [Homarus americanus]|uniref:myosin regulatory light chain 2-like n=1 Tax=Homarus americanus TaxID=6706 RepID=UPI001C4672D8|nr:myosin regulatory light chain 2-like [Homarus americanus]